MSIFNLLFLFFVVHVHLYSRSPGAPQCVFISWPAGIFLENKTLRVRGHWERPVVLSLSAVGPVAIHRSLICALRTKTSHQ
ncbi:hypothetical protein B0H21DRAFT_762334 [Amylocystis lapponica]|nr:hypothetical protein B0H21DRAFT_762334 [Amylocystis lapponica]